MLRTQRLSLAIVALLLPATAARADNYYVIVFGAESKPQRPKFSHSWATFVRLPASEGPSLAPTPIESFTISWLPQVVVLHPLRLRPEPGANFDLPTTLQAVLSQCEEVAAWGPFEIQERLYCRALRHKQQLEADEIRYKTIDFAHNPNRVSNCIHALTVFNTENRRLRVGRTNFGERASFQVAQSYADWIVNSCQTHCWVADILGLNDYPIKWRSLEEGRPG
ncbi:MAG: hypothetical protein ACJ8F7_13580 [Gemmataceae bacterium]